MTAEAARPLHAGDTLGSLGPWREGALRKLDRGIGSDSLTAEFADAARDWCQRRVPEATWQWVIPLLDDLSGMGPAVPGAAQVIVDGKNWLPADLGDGEAMILLPVWDIDDQKATCAEVLALRPRTTDWYRRTGLVDVLGECRADQALVDDKPLRIFRHPAGWLKAGGRRSDGICVLDWAGWLPSQLLSLAPSLIADDPAHAAELHRLTRRPRHLPKIAFVAPTPGKAA